MEFHELTEIFPMMSAEEFAALKADIKANGLLESIWTYDGKIIDGRNRFNACREVGVEPRFREWSGNGSLISFVISLNLIRRHLNESQRALIAARLANIKHGGDRRSVQSANLRLEINQSEAAKMLNVGERTLQQAKYIIEKAPEEIPAIERGEKTVYEVLRQVKKSTASHPPPLPTDKYRVLYSDPPWRYSDSGVINDDNYGRAERHYATMSIEELCDMGDSVKEISEDNAVLFLWTTSPMLEEAFKIIRAWGFKYKTSFVWDKIKHNFGHYNSVRHEFLLICTRGSCVPDTDKKYDSVVSIERTPKHSEKPEEFREIINTLYPNGKRIELFARSQHKDWEVWGNQV